MISRRAFLGTSLGAGAALALTPELLRAHQPSAGTLMQRAIPSSGEKIPVVSFGPRPTAPPGPGAFKPMPTDLPAAREVLKTFIANGGKVVDVMHGGPIGEEAARMAAEELGIQNKCLWTTPSVTIPNTVGPLLPGAVPKADPAVVRARLEEKFAALKVSKVDLVMVSTLVDTPGHLAVLREMKKEGRVRYIGVHHLAWPRTSATPPFAELEAIMRDERIDFVGTDYNVLDRRAEETLLPLALERKIGFMAYFTFDRGRLFQRAGTTPLPEWAAEFDAKTWAQFFVKYVLSHPAVTVARTGTTNAAHMLENIGGGIGRLPNAAMRKRMAQLADTFPPLVATATAAAASSAGRIVITEEQVQQMKANQPPGIALSAAILDRYVGEYQHEAAGTMVTVRRDGDRLLVKVQTRSFAEEHFLARSETRFESTPFAIEFQLDGQGRVTGAVWEAFKSRIPLVRK
jgi:aryl-alcohol dehydrogenase-like predicted oxidoreductase